MQTTLPVPLDVFSSELSPGETVQWSGQPNARVIFHGEDWGIRFHSACYGEDSPFFGYWVHLVFGTFGITTRIKTLEWFGVVLGHSLRSEVGQYMIWGRFVHDYWKKHRTYYALTTKRALIVVDGLGGRTASSAYFENTGIIEKSVRKDGIGRISFGGPVTGEWRWGRNNPPRPPTFDDVDSADSVYQIAARLREQIQKPGTYRVP